MNLILPAVILLLSGACSIRYYQPATGILNEDRFAIIRSDSLLIAIRPSNYQGSNGELSSRYFPVFIRIRNNSIRKQTIGDSNFSILANEKQYDPIPLDYILHNIGQNQLLNANSDPFDLNDAVTMQNTLAKEQDLYYDVVANAFGYGDILVGGIKEGYLFYNRSIADADSISIDVFGKSIGFVKK
ncbi:MAG: hypothetical protein PHO32_07100 [Candidatus Cloacimonetes bacterium]|nr:hypothetical protein [Candidatus Cloacimonadota bacterium]